MKCNICQKSKTGAFCTCGYCMECVEKLGHDKCSRIEQERRKENDVKETIEKIRKDTVAMKQARRLKK